MTAHQVRFEVLDVDDNMVGVCHPVLSSGVVAWSSTNRIQRTLSGLTFAPGDDSALTAGQSRIRPVWVTGDGTEYTLGVFLFLGGPVDERTTGDWLSADVMPDRTWQLDQKLPASFSVDGGSVITDVLGDLCDLHGITSTQRSITTSAAVTGLAPLAWSAGDASGMDVAKVLTGLAGFLPPHTDNAGRVVFRPVPIASDDWPAHEYYDGQAGTVAQDTVRSSTSITDRPNRYLVRSTTPTGDAVSAVYDIPASAGNSRASIGYYITRAIDADGLASSAQARAVAVAAAQADSAKVSEVTFTAVADPTHDAYEVVDWQGENMLEQSWSLPLSGGAMSHRVTASYQ